ncbi:MAG: hypothetical protein AB1566_12805 [Chloroflexota bacterium]
MHTQRRWLLGVPLALAVAVLALLVTAQSAYVAPPYLEGIANSFRYTGQGQRNGSLYVNISVNLDDPVSLQKYIEANRQRGRDLVHNGRSPIPIRVTFARPLSLGEVRDLVRESGLQVSSFAMVGHSSLSGKRGMHVEFSSVDKEVPATLNMDPTGNGEQLVLTGVMVLYGEILNPQGLARLLADERVYLADTSEVEVRELLAQRHASVVAGKELVVSVPSPFWKLDW